MESPDLLWFLEPVLNALSILKGKDDLQKQRLYENRIVDMIFCSFDVCIKAKRFIPHTQDSLLLARILRVAQPTATVAGQLHGGNDNGAGFIHIDNGHHFMGDGLTAWHLVLGKDKESRNQTRCIFS